MTVIMRVDPELKKLLNEIKREFAINGIKISDTAASKILAKKIKKKDLDLFDSTDSFFKL